MSSEVGTFMDSFLQNDRKHFKAELDLFDDDGLAHGVRCICKIGDRSASQIISETEIEQFKNGPELLAKGIRRNLWRLCVYGNKGEK